MADRIEQLASGRAAIGDNQGKPSAPWEYPDRDFISEAQEEAADGWNYCIWGYLQRQENARLWEMASAGFKQAFEALWLIQTSSTSEGRGGIIPPQVLEKT